MLLVFSLCHFRVKIFSKGFLASNKTGTNSQSGVVSLFGQYAYYLPRDTNARTCGGFPWYPETLQQYRADEAKRRSKEKVVICFQTSVVLPALAQHLQDAKHQYGWTQEEPRTDGGVKMTFSI
jgi:hypothetical protein